MNLKATPYLLARILSLLTTDEGMPVLCYHGIDDSASPTSLAAAHFRMHVQLLHQLGYRSLRISDVIGHLRSRTCLPKKTVAFTFDDGLESVYTRAAPLMQEYGFVGTVFIIAGTMGKAIPWRNQSVELPRLATMNWHQVEGLHRIGFEIGSHSSTHQYLTRSTAQHLQDEIMGSRNVIADRLSSEVRSFAYPFGACDERVVAAVSDAGYWGACAMTPAQVQSMDSPFMVPRLFVGRDASCTVLKAYLSPGISVGFRIVTALRNRQNRHRPWYVPDPDGVGCVACDSVGQSAPW